MSGDVQVRFCESRAVRSRPATHPVVHCVSESQAQEVLAAIRARLSDVGLELHPEKTRIVYCKDDNRRGEYENTSFTFLGFTFRPRSAHNSKSGATFVSFSPAISKDALNKISGEVRSWRMHRHVNTTFTELARFINPVVAGWMRYYGRFNRSALYPLLQRVNAYLVRWIRGKYKRLRGKRKAYRCLQDIIGAYPRMFAH